MNERDHKQACRLAGMLALVATLLSPALAAPSANGGKPAPAAKVVTLIIISKAQNLLRAYSAAEILATYPVATGRGGCTPEGTFTIVNKAVNPGKPALGARWMGLNKVGRSGRRYGIHGTNQPSSIGKYRSAGCIRLHNINAIALFDRTPVGARVLIIRDNLPAPPPAEEQKHDAPKQEPSGE